MLTFPIVKSDQKAVLGVAITFAILPVIAVFLRLLARHISHRKLDISDWFIIAAAILAVALEGISITGVIQCGIGYDHMLNIIGEYGMDPITKLLKLIIPLQIFWAVSLTFSKISVLLLYSKVFAVPGVIWTARITLAIIAMWCIGTVVAGLTICQPLAYNWDQTIEGGHCGDQVLSFTITGAINLITDVFVLALPLPSLYKLQLPLYRKIVLITVFSIGFMTCIISGFRIHSLSSMDFTDITYSIPQANIFSGLEPSIAVVLACIPLLRPLLGRNKFSGAGTPNYVGNSQTAPRSVGKDGRSFEPLSDDSSQYNLRPLGPKYEVNISESREAAGDSDVEVSEPVADGRGIHVRQEWNVSNKRVGR